MSDILFVEDSPEVYNQVSHALANLSNIVWAKTLHEAQEAYSKNKFDIVLLDINLPDGNGIEFCTHIMSENPEQSVFIITGQEKLSDKVLGFTAGADDYIVKPFNSLELKVRVENKLKKLNISSHSSAVTEWENLKIDKNKQQAFILKDEKFVSADLTNIEFRLLIYLADREGDVIPRDTILNEIWGQDVFVYSRSVDTHISKLRKKLEQYSNYIKSVHGKGYKFSVE